ncbi:MAG: enoyl-CoA hydratase/isomerase family protein [Acidimicrobiales bacterium]|nr:enoyl-CoA hydratase/isomerase family protein [Acidimicrobiales bacterium]
MELRLTTEAFVRLIASPTSVDDLASEQGGLVVLEDGSPGEPVTVPPLLAAVVVRVSPQGDPATAGGADVASTAAGLDAIRAAVAHNPQSTTSLAMLLRGADERPVADGLHAESAVYGVLQGGAEFSRWRGDHPVRHPSSLRDDPVIVTREGDALTVVLARPELRNALDVTMRDALASALLVALEVPVVRVELRGAGTCFCSGGYLDEFGTRPDPAVAHLVRLSRSLGWMLHQLSARTHVHVHGPCRGSGVELPAFAARVTADPDATFGLPEVAMGLIPGSGGTVSLPRRIGRARTAWLALSGAVIDAPTALAWGLVDEIT